MNTQLLKQEVQTELTQNIFPFWMNQIRDHWQQKLITYF